MLLTLLRPQHIKRILQLLKSHRGDSQKVLDEIVRDATVIAERLGLEEDMTSVPRIVGMQCQQKALRNSGGVNSLEERFAEKNIPSIALPKPCHHWRAATEPEPLPSVPGLN